MQAKMMRAQQKHQFAAVFCCGSGVSFFDVLNFSLCREKFFFALLGQTRRERNQTNTDREVQLCCSSTLSTPRAAP